MKFKISINRVLIITIILTIITAVLYFITDCSINKNSCSLDSNLNLLCGLTFIFQLLTIMYWLFYILTLIRRKK